MRSDIKESQKELREIINTWDLIPGAPSDEFDSLNQKVLSILFQGADRKRIYDILSNELTEYYGLNPNRSDLETLTVQVLDWWNNKKNGA